MRELVGGEVYGLAGRTGRGDRLLPCPDRDLLAVPHVGLALPDRDSEGLTRLAVDADGDPSESRLLLEVAKRLLLELPDGLVDALRVETSEPAESRVHLTLLMLRRRRSRLP